MPAAVIAASTLRCDSGSPVQASAFGQDRRGALLAAGWRHQQECLSSRTVNRCGENRLGAARLPSCALDPGRPNLANDGIDVSALVLGSPIAHGNQSPKVYWR